MLFSPWRRWSREQSRLAPRASGPGAAGRLRYRPGFEALEGRVVPATLIWNGNLSNLWSSVTVILVNGLPQRVSNWTSNDPARAIAPVPMAGDDLVFPAAAKNLVNSDDLQAGLTFNSITFQDQASPATGYVISGNLITLGGAGLGNPAAVSTVTNGAGTNQLALPLDLEGNTGMANTFAGAVVSVTGAAGNLTLSGAISGVPTAGLAENGPGTLTLAGSTANTYLGTTTVKSGTLLLNDSGGNAVPAALAVNGGTVSLGNNEQIANTAAVAVNAPGSLALNGHTETISSLSGDGTIVGPGTLILAGSTPSKFTGTLTAGVQISQQGAGGLQVGVTSGSNGSITVKGGQVLVLNGSSQPNVSVTVLSGGTLAGSGTVGPTTVASGGTLALGSGSAGVLTVAGALTFQAGASLVLPLTNAGTALLHVTGPLNLGGPGGTILHLVISPDFAPADRAVLTIIQDDDGPVQGTFILPSGQALPEGSLLLHGAQPPDFTVGQHLELSYALNQTNNVGLTNLDQKQLFILSLFNDFKVPVNAQMRASLDTLSEPAIAQKFLGSKPQRLSTLTFFYQQLGLDPNADPNFNKYLNGLVNGSLQPAEVLIKLVTSRQFKRSHRSNRTFVDGLVADVLGNVKAISKGQRALVVQELNQGTLTRALAAQDLLSSDAVLMVAIRENIVTFLGRPPKPGEVASDLVLLKQGGLNPDNLSISFLLNPEHLNGFLTRAVNGQAPPLVAVVI